MDLEQSLPERSNPSLIYIHILIFFIEVSLVSILLPHNTSPRYSPCFFFRTTRMKIIIVELLLLEKCHHVSAAE